MIAMMYMTPWHRRQGKEARLVSSLRGHVETMWAIACTLTGDEATAVEVVKEVVRGTLPQPYRSRQRGLRLEVVIAATEAGAARAFSPLDRRVRSGAYAAVLSPQASALRRAFSRRVSWDVQAPLWATEVEDIAESDVANRLGQSHQGMEAGRVALRLAYIDLRRDLDVNCRETLRNAFGSSADPERRGSGLPSGFMCSVSGRDAVAHRPWIRSAQRAPGAAPRSLGGSTTARPGRHVTPVARSPLRRSDPDRQCRLGPTAPLQHTPEQTPWSCSRRPIRRRRQSATPPPPPMAVNPRSSAAPLRLRRSRPRRLRHSRLMLRRWWTMSFTGDTVERQIVRRRLHFGEIKDVRRGLLRVCAACRGRTVRAW